MMCARGISNSGGIECVAGGGGCADSLWLRAAFYSHLSPTSKHHAHVKNYDLQKGEQIKPLVSAFSFYCLLTDYFYNMIMCGDRRFESRASNTPEWLHQCYPRDTLNTLALSIWRTQGLSFIQIWIWKTTFFFRLKCVYQCCGCIGTNF